MVAGEAQHQVAGAGIGVALDPRGSTSGGAGIGHLLLARLGRRHAVVLLEIGIEFGIRARRIVVDGKRQVHRAGEGRRIPAGGTRRRLNFRPLCRVFLDAGRVGEPAVEVPADPLPRRRDGASDPDRRSARAMRCRAEHATFDFPAPVPVDGPARPERTRQRQTFNESADPLLEGNARSLELRAGGRPVGGDADSQDHAALGDAIERGHLLREHDGIAKGRKQHGGAEFHSARPCRDGGEERQRIVPRSGEKGVAYPDRIESQRLGPFRQRKQRSGFRISFHGAFAGRQQVSQFRHRRFPLFVEGS